MIHIKSSSVFIFPLILSCLSSCAGEDRSGERPLVPVVETLEAEVVGGFMPHERNCNRKPQQFPARVWLCVRHGRYNKCKGGGRDTVSYAFTVVADSLQDGEYYYAAYARNGI